MLFDRVRRSQILLALVLAAASALILVGAVYAAEFRGKDEVIIGADEVINDDLYVGARRLIVDGTIRGDLIAGAQEIIINGAVEGDVFAAAQYVTVNGTVGDSAVVAAMTLSLNSGASVGYNVMFAGFGLDAKRDSQVGHDVLVAGYQAQLNGGIDQDVRAGLGALEVRGQVGRDVNATVGEADEEFGPWFFFPGIPVSPIDPGLRIGEGAVIGGELRYTSRSAGAIAAGAEIQGGVTRELPAGGEAGEAAGGPDTTTILGLTILSWIARTIGTIIALLIVGGLVLWLLPEAVYRATEILEAKPLPSLGWGCLTEIVFLVGVPVTAAAVIVLSLIIGAVTLGQLLGSLMTFGLAVVGLISATFGIVIIYVTKVVVAFLVGGRLLRQLQPSWEGRWFWPLLIGVILFVILRAMPILGALISFAVTLIGLGAIVLMLRDYWQERRADLV